VDPSGRDDDTVLFLTGGSGRILSHSRSLLNADGGGIMAGLYCIVRFKASVDDVKKRLII
jgi:hypothetical protein